MKRKIKVWLRKLLLDTLQLPDTFICANVHMRHPTDIMVIRLHHGDRTVEVIADYQSRDRTYREILEELKVISRRYNVPAQNVVIDRPYFS